MRRSTTPKHVFCIEGDWDNDLRKTSTIVPALELLAQDTSALNWIYRTAATREQFDHYLRKWNLKRYREYKILWLAFHGEREHLVVGDQRNKTDGRVSIDDLAEALRGKCVDRIVHLGSCSVLKTHGNRVQSFLRTTRALAVSGFDQDVYWLESSIFEAFYLGLLQDAAFNPAGISRVRNRLNDAMRGLHAKLGFRLFVRKPKRRA